MSSMSRRSFLKLTGTAAVAAAGTAMLSGCGVQLVPFHLSVSQYGNPKVADGTTETLNIFVPEFLVTSGAMASLIDWLIDNEVRPEFKRRYKNCTDVEVTSDAANSSKVVRNADGSYSMTLTVRVIMADDGKDDSDTKDETVYGDVYFYDLDEYLQNPNCSALYAIMGTHISLTDPDIDGYMEDATKAFLGNEIRLCPRAPYPSPATIDYTKDPPRLKIFFEFVDAT